VPYQLMFAVLTLFGPGSGSQQANTAPQKAGWKLVWLDEFESPGAPDPAKWGYDVGGHGWGNNELQFYRDSRDNARVEDGRLIVEARKESFEGRTFTSARLVSKGKGEWRYGRIETRAKLPAGRGTWPAIWLLPATPKLRWPDDGEIDVMEHVGFDPGVVHASIHTKRFNHMIGTQKTGKTQVADCSTAFHDYAVEWSATRMDFFVDDRKYFSFAPLEDGSLPKEDDSNLDGKADVWPFQKKFYLILNVAVGGNWGGQKGVDESVFPARMEVEYVRVYEREAR
jgi:beta-glucanase (GH16 family)